MDLEWRLDYDKGLLEDLNKVLGSWTSLALASLLKPPNRYYLRANRLKIETSILLDAMRDKGYEVFLDEQFNEALWIPTTSQNPRQEEVDCYVYVDKRAAESVMIGANLYWPGVLRAEKCVKKGKKVGIVFQHKRRKTIVGIGVSKFNYGEQRKRGLAVLTIRPLYKLPSLRDTAFYSHGLIYEQSLPSITVTRVLDPEPHSTVVDMCAAPGGKTTHIYEYTGGRITLYAFDISKTKIARLKEEVARLGHRGIKIVKSDSRYLDKDYPFLKADYVLLDPPCSSLGVTPKVYHKKTMREIIASSDYQKQFLKVAARILKRGGILVYSTCTITFKENEENIIYAVQELGFELEEAYPFRGSRSPVLRETQRFHPHIHGSGYFIARLRKK